MNEEEVVILMKSSKSSKEWDENCDKVKDACGGYPGFWFRVIIAARVLTTTPMENNWPLVP
jgi:ABC-type Fe3+ transport system substrate-binding protein